MDDVERTMPMPRPAPPGLPRRRRQAHIEPQLREPGGAGTGTPFVAFVPGASAAAPGAPRHRADGPGEQAVGADGADTPDAAAPGRPHDADAPGRRAAAGARVATFRAGARREPQPRS